MAGQRPLADELRAWLERAAIAEGGVNKADEACGLPRGTFSRWLTTGVTPSADNLLRVVGAIGKKNGTDALQIFILAGLLPKGATGLPRIASTSVNAALLDIQDRLSLEDALAAERAAMRAVEPWLPRDNPRGTGARNG